MKQKGNKYKRQQVENVKSIDVTKEVQLLEFLFEQLSDLSRTKIKSLLARDMIQVDGRSISQFDFPLKPGMKISVLKRTNNILAGNPYLNIVYEDNWLIVINKRPGILSMQSDHHSFCVKTLLDDYFSYKHSHCKAHVVHRLDRDTSGLMVFAKNTDVQQQFENHWQELVTDRRYVALVLGRMEEPFGTIKSWLQDDKFFFTHSSPVNNGGKLAITHYVTIDSGEKYSLVELKLETGRKNQIRVHMADIGHPVVGDTKYSPEMANPLKRLGLHAFRLYFTHPVTGKALQFETPYPTSFEEPFKVDEDMP